MNFNNFFTFLFQNKVFKITMRRVLSTYPFKDQYGFVITNLIGRTQCALHIKVIVQRLM